MQACHHFDLDNSAALTALRALLEARFGEPSPERAASQPDFERSLREHLGAFEREVHAADFEAMDVEAPGVIVDGQRYRRRAEKTAGIYTTLADPIRGAP